MSRIHDNLISLMQFIEGLETESVAIELNYHRRGFSAWWHCTLSTKQGGQLDFELENSEDCYTAITQIKEQIRQEQS